MAVKSSRMIDGKAMSAHAAVVLPLTTMCPEGGIEANANSTARLDLPSARASWEAGYIIVIFSNILLKMQ